MLHDVDFFQSRLSKIDGFGDTGDYLKGIINSKEVRTVPTATKTGSSSGEEGESSGESEKADAKGETEEAESK